MSGSLATIYSAELEGIRARLIEVEVDINAGIHSFNIVGLADKALNEAKERVNAALKNSDIKPPNRENRKITVNLAPADVKKTGSQYDLAIALGYLVASKQIGAFATRDKLFVGELALDGRVRPVNGVLNIAEMAARRGFKYVFVPTANAAEAAVYRSVRVIPLNTLREAINFLEERASIVPAVYAPKEKAEETVTDFSEVKGQEYAKRALTIAAAGGHNMLMVGPPGVGKSMLAQAMLGILPRLTLGEAIEVTKIYSAAGLHAAGGLITRRPFRAPHQTASAAAVVGGGSEPKPGEISLAHLGILFLDELPEFQKNILESLRQPLERGAVHVARAKQSLIFPAKFTLVAAMNPCPCGYYGDSEQACVCGAYEVIHYQKKISGPLLDRIDLQVKVSRVKLPELRQKMEAPAVSPTLRAQIETAREGQRSRFKNMNVRATVNAEMSPKQTEAAMNFLPTAELFLKTLEGAHLSARGYYRLLKTARTIADLAGEARVDAPHLAEAYGYRLKAEA